MALKLRTNFFFYATFSLFICAYLSHHYLHHHRSSSASSVSGLDVVVDRLPSYNLRAIQENLTAQPIIPQPAVDFLPDDSVSVLLPDWEILTIDRMKSSYDNDDDRYFCLFPNGESTAARFSGVLHFPERVTFKCVLPERSRRRMPFQKPFLTRNPDSEEAPASSPAKAVMLRWTYISYDSFSTEENDVVVLVKGLNKRQGVNREPAEFNCVFYQNDDVASGERTAVTSSMQEVFRCKRPEMIGGGDGGEVKVTVEIAKDRKALPSIAYYSAAVRTLANAPGREKKEKALLCACTMVYNVGKFLKEWVVYYSNLGVETFMLYDNGSDDDLQNVVAELVGEGYDVRTYFWLWPKAQEAGFSHSAVYLKSSCNWTAYIDVDEFIYSPAWSDSDSPSNSMLREVLSDPGRVPGSDPQLGEVSIQCREFGPSNRTENPPEGVTQGYTCRKSGENRHKSIVLNDAVDDSLLNMIHHFVLKPGFYAMKMSVRSMIVNHYKFQAWPEFKAKFRRRVSAYVVDWTQQVNPNSNDRTPGLGFSAVEPEGWPGKFCNIYDDGLKNLTRKWFAVETPSGGAKLAWQR